MEHSKLLIITEPFGSKIIKNYSMKPNLGSDNHRQEKPDLQEPPESAPAGIGVDPLLVTLLNDDNTFLIASHIPCYCGSTPFLHLGHRLIVIISRLLI